jgi:hypothetical protein
MYCKCLPPFSTSEELQPCLISNTKWPGKSPHQASSQELPTHHFACDLCSVAGKGPNGQGGWQKVAVSSGECVTDAVKRFRGAAHQGEPASQPISLKCMRDTHPSLTCHGTHPMVHRCLHAPHMVYFPCPPPPPTLVCHPFVQRQWPLSLILRSTVVPPMTPALVISGHLLQ